MLFKRFLNISFYSLFLLILSGHVQAQAPVKIAVIFARSGITAIEGLDYYLATYLAVEKINNKGGIAGRRLEVVEIDNKSTALGARAAALKAVEQDVTAVIGAEWSIYSLAMAPVLQEAGIPMITPLSTNTKVTKAGNFIFRTCFTDDLQGKAIALFAQNDLKARTSVILKNINNDYSLGLAESFRITFQNNGLKVLWEGAYSEKDTDFTGILKKVKALKPDVVYIPGHDKDSGLLIKQAREKGINALFLGSDGWSDRIYEFSDTAVENSYASTFWHPDLPLSNGHQIQKEYLNIYGKKMKPDQLLVYDAVMLLADAIGRAGSPDRKKIRDALAATKNFQAVTGTISFDDSNDPAHKEVVIVKFQKGTTVLVKVIKP